MALVSTGKQWVFSPMPSDIAFPGPWEPIGTGATLQLNANTEYWFPMFLCHEAFTADKFEFSVSAVGTGGNVDVRIYTINADGSPNATVGSTSTVNVTTAAHYEATGLAASLSAGTPYGVRVIPQTGVDVTLRVGYNASQPEHSPFGFSTNISGSVVVYPGYSYGTCCGLGPSTGYIPINTHWIGAADTYATTNISSTGTPFIGNKIVFPFACSIVGVLVAYGYTTSGDIRAVLANAAGTAHRTSFAANDAFEEATLSGGGSNQGQFMFSSAYDVAAGETVYVMAENTVAGNRGVYYRSWRANASLGSLWGTSNVYCTASALGTYTETTSRVAFVLPIISRLSDDAGSGGFAFTSRPGARFSA